MHRRWWNVYLWLRLHIKESPTFTKSMYFDEHMPIMQDVLMDLHVLRPTARVLLDSYRSKWKAEETERQMFKQT